MEGWDHPPSKLDWISDKCVESKIRTQDFDKSKRNRSCVLQEVLKYYSSMSYSSLPKTPSAVQPECLLCLDFNPHIVIQLGKAVGWRGRFAGETGALGAGLKVLQPRHISCSFSFANYRHNVTESHLPLPLPRLDVSPLPGATINSSALTLLLPGT